MTLRQVYEFDIFRFHFLYGADWKLCTRRLGIDRGTFFHAVYRIEARVGQALAEAQPYACFPIDEYFARVTRPVDIRPFEVSDRPNGIPLRPPLRPARSLRNAA